jgi:hypothetical protein
MKWRGDFLWQWYTNDMTPSFYVIFRTRTVKWPLL